MNLNTIQSMLPDSVRHALALIPFDTLIREHPYLYDVTVHLVEKTPFSSMAPTIDRTLGNIGSALVRFATCLGTHKRVAMSVLLLTVDTLKLRVHALFVGIGEIDKKYPYLFPMLPWTIVVLRLPDALILGPVLYAIGFGSLGPKRGSIAAWMQSTLFGGGVPAGSWFAGLQAAGMGMVPVWLGLITKASLIGGLFVFMRRASATQPG